ncbi:MAG: hypothetical protein ABI837_04780 [Acidobacteriota bacterium]
MGSIVYFSLCVIVAWFGRRRMLRFWGTLLLGIFLTPVVSLLVLVMGAPIDDCRTA